MCADSETSREGAVALPAPAAAAAAFGAASFETGLASVGFATVGAAGLAGRARPDGAGVDGGDAGGAVGVATNFTCAAAATFGGATVALGASAFLAAGLDSLHFS